MLPGANVQGTRPRRWLGIASRLLRTRRDSHVQRTIRQRSISLLRPTFSHSIRLLSRMAVLLQLRRRPQELRRPGAAGRRRSDADRCAQGRLHRPQRRRQVDALPRSAGRRRARPGRGDPASASCGWAICGSTIRFCPAKRVLEFLMRDSGQPDWKCGEVAGQFELKGAYLEGPVAKLSGGWQTRVKLAALLLHDPNLLLLDEPTNFLDLRTQILLEHFLRDFRAGLPDRLARSGVSGRHLHAHARSVARQADDVSRADRRLSRIPARAPRARRARQRRGPGQAPAAGKVHRQEPRPGQHRLASPQQGQAARTAAD